MTDPNRLIDNRNGNTVALSLKSALQPRATAPRRGAAAGRAGFCRPPRRTARPASGRAGPQQGEQGYITEVEADCQAGI